MVIIGGMYTYMSKRDAVRMAVEPPAVLDSRVDKLLTVEITPTFSVEGDPFALQLEENTGSGFELKLNGETIPLQLAPVRGEVIRIDSLSGVRKGHNEVYVKGAPPVSESHLENGIRVKVMEDGQVIADKTIWSSDGALASGTVFFDFETAEQEDSHDH